jgi:hypothetical protein
MFNNHPTELEEGQLAFNLAAENQNLLEGNANIYMYVGNGSDLRMDEGGTVLVPGDAAADDITLTGSIASSVVLKADSTYSLGTDSVRWASIYADNLYSGDLHLKNDRGDYTIIEEEDALTLRNNKTGKIYNFVL